jgi:hypothetical protein
MLLNWKKRRPNAIKDIQTQLEKYFLDYSRF